MVKNFNKNTLKNKNAIITGGGGLLGPRHGIALARAGANVTLIDINKEGLERAKREILKEVEEANVSTSVLDITSLEEVDDFANKYFQGKDFFHILVNNAAINPKMKELIQLLVVELKIMIWMNGIKN